ncbi:MAG: helix-turn-helix domain-containing protein [Piscirickettsiaceae bacterium]|nr:helix-turn-helix domain-containing protein [Piscirickettsiaceae bacterium]
MNKHHKIHLLHASIFEPFILATKQIGTPVEKILNKVNLPLQLLETQDILIPERPCWEFIREVSRHEGIQDFGMLATQAIHHDEMEALAPLLTGCENLFDLLKRFCLVGPTICDTADYTIEIDQDRVTLKQRGDRLLDDDIQVQLFEIAGMIQLINLATNYQWHPPEIHLTFKHHRDIENSELLGFSQILFNQSYPAITFPRAMLSLPLLLKHSHHSSPTTIPKEFISKVQHIVTPYFSYNLDIHMAAELIGTSVRTLQRRLEEQNSSFSNVVAKAKMLEGSSLLLNNELNLLDISLSLGYTDASSFSRAFRRWSGISPREYRAAHNDNEFLL